MKIVVDNSTLIRGLLKRYTEPSYIVDQIAKGNYKLLMTDEMAKELCVTIFIICQEKGLNPKKYLRAVSIFVLHAIVVKKQTNFKSCIDPSDSMFIECAIDGQARYCISSDHSIFNIKKYCTDQNELALIQNIEFYHPQDFYSKVVQKVPRDTSTKK